MAKPQDITGMKFGKLTAIEVYDRVRTKNGRTKYYWRCKCDCGGERITTVSHLKNGNTKSCGCANAKITHHLSNTRLYTIWCNMKKRCYDTNNHAYRYYGAKGIRMCDEWMDMTNFYNWSVNNGYSDELTIDRINVYGNYEPDNCRWVSMQVQYTNTRSVIHLTYRGETHTLTQWSEITGISRNTLLNRNKKGWSVDKILSNKNFVKDKNRKLNTCYIKEKIEEKGINRKYIAEMLGMCRQNVDSIVNGKRGITYENAKKIAEIIGADVEEIFLV